MPDLAYGLFSLTAILLILAPGPDILYVISLSLAQGKKPALATAMGLALGNMVHLLWVALGLAVVFKISWVYHTFLYLAALYLAYLAYQSWPKKSTQLTRPGLIKATRKHHYFVKGFLMNVTNPKVALFFLVFFPPFIPADAPFLPSLMILGILFIGLVMLIFGALALGVGHLGEAFLSPRYQHAFAYVTAIVLFVLSGFLVVEGLKPSA